MTFSFKKRTERGDYRNKIFQHAVQRSLIIFCLGIFLHLFPYFNFSTVRIPGVLQRIAVVYLIASFLYLYFKPKVQLIISIIILILYWLTMTFIPVPVYGAGNLIPEGNLAAYIDNLIFKGHMWKQNWDPEGLLSTFPAVVTTMIGIFTGMWLQKSKEKFETTTKMFVIGYFLIILGIIWDMWFPINKYIWTSSYVLFMGGMALNFLAICYYLIEIKHIKWWIQPFQVFGMNAIASFFLSSLTAKILNTIKVANINGEKISLKAYIFSNYFEPYFKLIDAFLTFAISYVVFWYIIMLIFYKKKIFIKV